MRLAWRTAGSTIIGARVPKSWIPSGSHYLKSCLFRAAAAEAIDREHVGTDLARLNRSYDPGAPKPHNNYIDFLIPLHLSRVVDDNRVKRRHQAPRSRRSALVPTAD
jgi:hypothetical protein